MILNQDEILNELSNNFTHGANIKIYPFQPEKLRGHSYILRLAWTIFEFDEAAVKAMHENRARKCAIHKEGFKLHPGYLYRASTIESVQTRNLIPQIIPSAAAKSVGIQVANTNGFWGLSEYKPLELILSAPIPTIIYPEMPIAEIYFIRANSH